MCLVSVIKITCVIVSYVERVKVFLWGKRVFFLAWCVLERRAVVSLSLSLSLAMGGGGREVVVRGQSSVSNDCQVQNVQPFG